MTLTAAAFLGAAAFGSGLARATSITEMSMNTATVCIIVGFTVFCVAGELVHHRIKIGGTRRVNEKKTFALITNVMTGKFPIE